MYYLIHFSDFLNMNKLFFIVYMRMFLELIVCRFPKVDFNPS
jgi:hypothetical protein